MRTADGRFWFATYGGVAVIDPEAPTPNPIPPPVYVERVAAGGSELRLGGNLLIGESFNPLSSSALPALRPRPASLAAAVPPECSIDTA